MTKWLEPREQDAWRLWLETTSRVLVELDERLQASSGLASTDYEILVMLSEAPEHMVRMSELADLVLVSRSRLTYRVDRLVDRGLVVREECPDDKRGLNAHLTPDGFGLLKAAAPGHVADVRELLVDHVRHDELDVVTQILQRILDGLNSET